MLFSPYTEGYFSGCHYLDGGRGYTVQQCKDLALNLGANLFNYRASETGECYIKKCVSLKNPELQYSKEGYDIYVDYCKSCINLNSGVKHDLNGGMLLTL